MAQKLSKKAKKAKHNRDVKAAKTPKRKARKRQNQKIGQRSNSDIHHTKSGATRRVSIKKNRGGHGRGTTKE